MDIDEKKRAAQPLFQSVSDDGTRWLFIVLSGDGWAITRNGKHVEMGTADEAAKAIQLLNGQEVDGRAIKVSEARSQERDAAKGGFDRSHGHHGRERSGHHLGQPHHHFGNVRRKHVGNDCRDVGTGRRLGRVQPLRLLSGERRDFRGHVSWERKSAG